MTQIYHQRLQSAISNHPTQPDQPVPDSVIKEHFQHCMYRYSLLTTRVHHVTPFPVVPVLLHFATNSFICLKCHVLVLHISWIDGVNDENDTRSNSDERQTKGALLAISSTSVMHSGLLLSSSAIIGFQLTVCGWAVPRSASSSG